MDDPTDLHLTDAFDEIKGRDNKQRIYADFESFKAALTLFKPDCMEEFNSDTAAWENAAALHFRNACENVSTIEEAKIYTGEKVDHVVDDLESDSSEAEVPDEGEENTGMSTFQKPASGGLDEELIDPSS